MFLQPHVSCTMAVKMNAVLFHFHILSAITIVVVACLIFVFLPFGLYYTVKSRKKRAKWEEGGENRVQEMVWGQAVAALITADQRNH